MLTDTKIRQTKPAEKPIKLTDSHGLYLLIKPNGSKLWHYRYRIDGKENIFSIGSYPEVSLAEARQTRDEAKKLVKQQIHPARQRKEEKKQRQYENRNTFRHIAAEYIESKKDTSKTNQDGIQYILNEYVFPEIGDLPIKQITPQHVLKILTQCKETEFKILGTRVRQHIGGVFRLAIMTMRANYDPTLLFHHFFESYETDNATPLSKEEITLLWRHIPNSAATQKTKYAILLLMYTFVRFVELRRATWDEIDFEEKLWRIPARKMKKRRPHIVPLSNQVIEILNKMYDEASDKNGLIFKSKITENGMISPSVADDFMLRAGIQNHSGHDFRATASTFLNEFGIDERLIEMQLAHVQKDKTKAAYNHAKYLEKRREMMQNWADFVDSLKP